MGYRTLLIRDSERLKLHLDNILVETKQGDIRFLISDLKFLILDNYKATLSVQLLNKLTESNVAVVICDMTHMPWSQVLPLNGYYASSGVMQSQINWDNDIKSGIHQLIVQAKIQAQIDILKKNLKSNQVISRLESFKNEVGLDDLSNREGLAAKMYFRELFGPDFIRFEEDVINGGLNYGYAVFRSLISANVVSKGLLPNIGIFHKGKSNNFNLSDDLIEVYRPIVDDWVSNNLINKELLLKEDRESLIGLMDKKIKFKGMFYTINNSIELYIESIIKCFDNNDLSYFIAPSLEEIHDL